MFGVVVFKVVALEVMTFELFGHTVGAVSDDAIDFDHVVAALAGNLGLVAHYSGISRNCVVDTAGGLGTVAGSRGRGGEASD